MTIVETRRPGRGYDDDDDWRLRAACRGVDTNVFFPEGRGRLLRARENRAKEICASCPVKLQCDEWATKLPEQYGVWGGRTGEDRGYRRR